MPEREIDSELIAAFIDGRLSGEERRRAVAMLAQSEAAFEVYADALRVRADLDGDTVVPIVTARRRRGPAGWWAMAPLAAAAVLFVAVFPRFQARRDAALFGAPVANIARTLGERPAVARGLVGELDQRGWSVTRGGESRVVDTIAAFRLGVRSVDLQVALSAGDTGLAGRLTAEMRGVLERVPLSDAVQAEYSALRDSIANGATRDNVVAQASRAERAANEFFGSRWFGFGTWFAAGELAASRQSASFFASRETARVLDAAIKRGHLAPDDVGLLRQIAGLRGQGVSGEEFEAIRQNFQKLIRRHGE